VIGLDLAQTSKDTLGKLGVTNIVFNVYKGISHSVSNQEIKDILDFVQLQFNK
jgi:hypothetical protein